MLNNSISNTAYSWSYGLIAGTNVRDIHFRNNALSSVAGSEAYAIRFDDDHSYLTCENNVFWLPNAAGSRVFLVSVGGQMVEYTLAQWRGLGHDLQSKQADPLFVNAGATDLHLKDGSPAINAGSDVHALGVRLDNSGAARPLSGAYDCGAFER